MVICNTDAYTEIKPLASGEVNTGRDVLRLT